jgi:hypothetical protein
VKHLTRTQMTVLASVVVGLALAGCGSSGSNASTASTLSGVAAAQAPLGGAKLTVKDSSAPQQQKTLTTSDDGSFSLSVTGLQAPYMLQASWSDDEGEHTLRSVADGAGRTWINPLTEIALAAATTAGADGGTESDDSREYEHVAASVSAFLQQLRTTLAPLFDLYGIGSNLMQVDPTAMTALLKDVSFSAANGTLVVTNRATGAVIFSGPLSNLAAGTFNQGNLPAGPGTTTPPPPAACTYTYGAWGACQSDGTQTRTVAISSPAGCTGTPVLSQTCTYTPPATTCTSFLYSAWTPATCDATGVQSRTVVSSSPTGCTGGSPTLTQTCTYTPPPAACTYSYNAWGACQSNGTQTRTVATSSPAGCTGTPVLSQACTYVPPVTTCTSFTYSAWTPATCDATGVQTRTVASSSPSGCTGGSPVLTQSCTPPPVTCTSFTYSAWGTCSASGTQTRTVASSAPSGCTGGAPVLSQACTPPPPPNPVTTANIVSSCTGCHGLTSNSTVYKSGGYTVSGRSSAQWLTTVNSMVGMGASLAPGTTAQNYADALANAP